MKLSLQFTQQNKTSSVYECVGVKKNRLDLLQFWSLVECKFFGAGVDENWVSIMIAGDSRNSKKVIVRGGSQGVLASTLSIAPIDGVTGPSISNAVLFNF